MSIEAQCLYCNARTKFRCKTQFQADDCDTYARTQQFRKQAQKMRGERSAALKPTTVKVYDISIGPGAKLQLSEEALTRLETEIKKIREKDLK